MFIIIECKEELGLIEEISSNKTLPTNDIDALLAVIVDIVYLSKIDTLAIQKEFDMGAIVVDKENSAIQKVYIENKITPLIKLIRSEFKRLDINIEEVLNISYVSHEKPLLTLWITLKGENYDGSFG